MAADVRAAAAVPMASPEVADMWTLVSAVTSGEIPAMGLSAGERPAADVEVLCSAVASVEFELARRMAAAARAGSLPLVGDGAMLLGRGWSTGWARRLARAGAFAEVHPALGVVWASGVITSEHVHALARHSDRLTAEEMAAVITELSPWWGQLSPVAVAQFVARVIRALNPPPDPEPDEAAAYEARSLSFALTSDSVVLAGVLPRLEGEAVIAAIDAFAERLRSEADHVPASARRADGLVALVNAAHASGSIPTRGGLPVSVSVTLDSTTLGDQVWSTSRGHTLTAAEQRFTACDAMVTPIVIETGHVPRHHRRTPHPRRRPGPRGWLPEGSGDPTDLSGGQPPEPVRGAADHRTGHHPARHPDPAGRRPHRPDRHPRSTPRTGRPGQGVHHPRVRDPRRSLPDPPRPGLGRERRHGPTESRNVVLGASPAGRPGHVDHRPGVQRRPGAPTRTRRPTRNPLAREPRCTLDHHPHTPDALADLRAQSSQCFRAASSCRSYGVSW